MAEKITWDKTAEGQFQEILKQIPELIRGIAEIRVRKKAESLAAGNNSLIDEKVMVDAFFAETPPGFVPPMKKSMEMLGIDYIKYGYK